MQSPRSIWVIVAKLIWFHGTTKQTFNFYKLLSLISVTDMTCLLCTTHVSYVTHDVISLINMPTRQLHCFQLRHTTSSVHSTGHRTARTSIWFTTQSGAFCDTDAGSVTSTIWKNDWMQNGADLTRTSLTQPSTSGGSDCMGSVRENGGHFKHKL